MNRHFRKITASLFFMASIAGANTLQTQAGRIEGEALGEINRYLGIPYAQPPTGPLRWKAPRDPQPWSGVRSAKSFASPCAQKGNLFTSSKPEEFETTVGSEDCLYLNVWSPKDQSHLKPVVLFIHGGSNYMGAASLSLYDSSRLALEANAVVVTTNYRLGFFGALAMPSLHEGDPLDDSGNYTTLDLIQALTWIQKNAAQFGGDPGNVTVMGQSAGCMNVWGLVQSPLAKGKFHKAICLSGVPNAYPKIVAESYAVTLLAHLLINDHMAADEQEAKKVIANMPKDSIRDYMRSRSTAQIVAASNQIIIPVQHITDGLVIPAQGFGNLALGQFNRMPLMLGTVQNETGLLELLPFIDGGQRHFWSLMNADPRTVRKSDFMSPAIYPVYKAQTFSIDQSLRFGIDELADGASLYTPVYRYHFAWNQAPAPWDEVLGSFHGLDLAFIFGTFENVKPNLMHFAWTPENQAHREQLHQQMVLAFRSFFEQGNPGPEWKRWNLTHPAQSWK